jgi:hypothetical protein
VAVDGGLRVNLAMFMMPDNNREMVLVGEDRLGCVQGFFADTREEREALQKAHDSTIVRTIEDYRLTLPDELIERFKGSRALFVFRLQDRYEFWTQKAWRRLDDRYQHLGVARRVLRIPLAFAALPGRRRSG